MNSKAISESESIHSFIDQWFYSPLLGHGLFFTFIILFTQTLGLLGRVGESELERIM
jgi:hypothetical protein